MAKFRISGAIPVLSLYAIMALERNNCTYYLFC